MRSRLRTLAIVLCGAFALAGCMDLDLQAEVTADNTVSGTYDVAFDTERLRALEQLGAGMGAETSSDFPTDPAAFEQQLKDELDASPASEQFGEGVSAETYRDGDTVGMRVAMDNISLEQFNEVMAGDTSSGGPVLQLAREGDEFVVSGEFSGSGLTGQSEVPDVSSQDLGEGFDVLAQQFFQGFQLDIALTFPGNVTSSSDLASVDGRKVSWRVTAEDLTSAMSFDARASAIPGAGGGIAGGGDDGSGNGLVLLIVGIVAAAVVIALVVFFVKRPGRRPAAQQAGAGAAGAVPGWPSGLTGGTAPPSPPTPQAPWPPAPPGHEWVSAGPPPLPPPVEPWRPPAPSAPPPPAPSAPPPPAPGAPPGAPLGAPAPSVPPSAPLSPPAMPHGPAPAYGAPASPPPPLPPWTPPAGTSPAPLAEPATVPDQDGRSAPPPPPPPP